MKAVLALTLAFAVAFQHVHASCHLKEIDLCLAGMILFSQGTGLIPDTEESVEQFCNYVQEGYQCVGNYSQKCMTQQLREFAGLFVEGAVHSTNEFCTSGSEIQSTWLKHAPCLSENFDQGRKCFDDIIVSIDAVTTAKVEDRVTLLCCALSRVRKCLKTETEKACNKDTAEMIDVLIKTFASDIPLIMAQPFDPESDRCKRVLPPEGTKPKEGDEQSAIGRLLSAFLGS